MLLSTLLAVAAMACTSGGGSRPAATATLVPTEPSPTATPLDLGLPAPESGRVVEHVEVLAGEIGIRLAGSPAEDEAVAYATEQFEGWGYDVEVQDFSAVGHGVLRYATLELVVPERREFASVAIGDSGAGEVTGPLLDAGTGANEAVPADASGAVLLIQRLDVPFAVMALRAEDAGAVAVIVSNKEPGLFPGSLETPSSLPMIAIGQADGDTLRDLLAAGAVEVSINVRPEVMAHNVIARPESGTCRTLTGGHYDSVAWTPGAYDNGSGAAVVLELARAAASAGLDGHCFVLFGAEEEGLLGSEFFIASMSGDERDALEAVFNYDAVAGEARLQLIGGTALAEEAQALAVEIGASAAIGALPENASSDHARFLDAGLAALMLTAPDPGVIHTSADTVANLVPDSLQVMVDLGFALLQEHSPAE